MDEELTTLRAALSDEEWQRRVVEAERQACVLDRVQMHVQWGMSQRAAFRLEAPDEPATTWVARYKRYERGGADGLIDKSVPVQGLSKNSDALVALVRAVALTLEQMSVDAFSPIVRHHLQKQTGEVFSEATVKRLMARAGVSKPVGRPPPQPQRDAHPLAGAELLLAVDQHLGVSGAMTAALHQAIQQLQQPDDVVGDTEHRDEHGRFNADYNQSQPRTQPELGADFDSVSLKRNHKDLPAMRVAHTSHTTLQRKLRAMMLLPVVTDSPRWTALRHWDGEHLGSLVGVAYQPATLDKFARELKYADVASVMVEHCATFWLGQTDLTAGPIEGMAVLYADATTKPVWTHHFTKCAKVSGNGRIMPAISTTYLHTGPGTPLLFTAISGTAPLSTTVTDLLSSYEVIAGEQTPRRLLVMDQGGYSVDLMKRLHDGGWQFIVPLKRSVTGKNAKFSELTDWMPYNEAGDEVRGGKLSLNDSKAKHAPLEARVVARRRHRTGKVAWYATLTDAQEVPDAVVLDAYFARWPLQEQRFRDGNGRVHLDSHYGYGKLAVDNVAVLDRIDTLTGQLRALDARLVSEQQAIDELSDELSEVESAIETAGPGIVSERAAFDEAMREQPITPAQQQEYLSLRVWERWLQQRQQQATELRAKRAAVQGAVASCTASQQRKREALQLAQSRTRIFTVDVALDQVMTALKLTFMNLCAVLMAKYLPGPTMQLDTLIRGVLTLPGERERTAGTETIRLYRADRDRQLMEHVGEACRRLTALQLTRDGRRLCFELVDPPRRVGPVRGAAADTG